MRLTVVRGPSPTGPFELRDGVSYAGRAPECEIFLPSKRVSRKHASFEVRDGHVEVRDLDSHNGIVDSAGRRVMLLALLPGARVQVGDYLLRLEGEISPDPELELEDDELVLEDDTGEASLPAGRGRGKAKKPPDPSRSVILEPEEVLLLDDDPRDADPATIPGGGSDGTGRTTRVRMEPPKAPPPAPPVLPFPPRGGFTAPFSPPASGFGEPAEKPTEPKAGVRKSAEPIPFPVRAEPEPPPPFVPSPPRAEPPPPFIPPPPRAEPAPKAGFPPKEPQPLPPFVPTTGKAGFPPQAEPPPPTSKAGFPPKAEPPPPFKPAPFHVAEPLPPPPFVPTRSDGASGLPRDPTTAPQRKPDAPLPFGPAPGGFAAPAAAPEPPPPPPRLPPRAETPTATLPLPATPPPPVAPPLPGTVATASGVPWLAQAMLLLFLVVGTVLCAPFGGLLAQLRAGMTQTEEVSVLRGVALAESLASRNAQPLADQRGLALETTFLLEKEGVHDAVIVDRTGTVLAPPDKLRTSVALQPAWIETSRTGETAVAETDRGDVQIAVPIRAQPGGAGPKQIVGYALVDYDPAAVTGSALWVGLGASLFVVVAVMAMLIFGAWWLVLRPIAALREETELAFLGDTHDVVPPVRLTQVEQLAHSINRLAARARGAGRR